MEETTNIPVGGPVTVSFNHEADVRTLTADNISLKASDGTSVAVKSVEIDYTNLNKLTFTPAAELAGNTEYTVDLSNVKDWAGKGCLPVKFTTGIGGDVELVPIESLSVTASGSLIQTEGKTTPGRIYRRQRRRPIWI